MTSTAIDLSPLATNVEVTADRLTVELADGRGVSVPLAWFPRLLSAAADVRNRWELIGEGEGIHWPDLDEDISVEGLLAGRPSGESQASFKKWLGMRGGHVPPGTASQGTFFPGK